MSDKFEESRLAREKAYADQLSPGTYVWKQIRSLLITFAGVGGGLGITYLLKKHGKIAPNVSVPQWMAGKADASLPVEAIGGFGGALVSGLFQGYEHWSKMEAERLAVDEISRDIAEARFRMNPELVRENENLRELVKQQQSQIDNMPPKTRVKGGDATHVRLHSAEMDSPGPGSGV